MSIFWRAVLFGTIAALGAIIAQRGFGAFHDGIRPSIREISRNKGDRTESAKSVWEMSIGFILYYGLPFSLVTGVMEKHIFGLMADWIGVRFHRTIFAALSGALWGVSASLVLAGAQWLFRSLPHPISQELLQIATPLIATMPLIPVIAATVQFGVRKGLFLVGVPTFLSILIIKIFTSLSPTPTSFILGVFLHIILATREKNPAPFEFPEALVDGVKEIRKGSVLLMLSGGAFALAGSLLWLGGEPAAVMLIGVHHPIEAGLIGLYSWIGFAPLVTYTALASRAYSPSGMPDGISGLGLLVRIPVLGPFIGAGAMFGEIWGAKSFIRVFSRYPGLHGAGAAIRDGLLIVTEISLFVGGVLSANSIWPTFGIYIVVACWLLNEAGGRPVLRVAVGPLATIGVGLLMNIYYLTV